MSPRAELQKSFQIAAILALILHLRAIRWLLFIRFSYDGREIRLRRITEPTAEQKALLQQLGLTLAERFELNRKCSADSAIA